MFQVAETRDGSHTLINTRLNQSYHSMHGALQESMHVFVQQGLLYFLNRNSRSMLRILELGYGTGLNAMLTYLTTKSSDLEVLYTAIEPFPIDLDIALNLNYSNIPGMETGLIRNFHSFDSEGLATIHSNFKIKIHKGLFEQVSIPSQTIDLIYFDAFSPDAQPELWTSETLKKCFNMLDKPGVWVTYSSKGSVRRSLTSVGFQVEKIPGPPGKREMLRALKL